MPVSGMIRMMTGLVAGVGLCLMYGDSLMTRTLVTSADDWYGQ